jgi:GDP-D-mannose dehydratase
LRSRISKKYLKEIAARNPSPFAASTSVAYGYEHPVEVIDENLIGTISLAEAYRTE